jgi:hypothetical protein
MDPRLAIDLIIILEDVDDPLARPRLIEIVSDHEPGSLAGKDISVIPVGDGEFNFRYLGRATDRNDIVSNKSWDAEHKVARISAHGGSPKSHWTRAVRAIVLLEQIGSPEAIAILKTMSEGHPAAEPTRVAKEALGEKSE